MIKHAWSCRDCLSLAFLDFFYFFFPPFFFFDRLCFNVLQHSNIIPQAAGQTHARQIIVIKNRAHLVERRVIMPALSQTARSRTCWVVFFFCYVHFSNTPKIYPNSIVWGDLCECNFSSLPLSVPTKTGALLEVVRQIIQRRLRLTAQQAGLFCIQIHLASARAKKS